MKILATIISLFTLFVVFWSAKISKEKIRLELYNKRFSVYSTVMSYSYIFIIHNQDKFYDNGIEEEFILAFRESQFLFKSKSNIYKIIKEIQNTASFIKNYYNQSKLDSTDMKHNQIIEKCQGLESRLNALEKSMMPYLNFSSLSWWQCLLEIFSFRNSCE